MLLGRDKLARGEENLFPSREQNTGEKIGGNIRIIFGGRAVAEIPVRRLWRQFQVRDDGVLD